MMGQNKAVVRAEILKQFSENHEKFLLAAQKFEEALSMEKNWVLIDWEEDKEALSQKGVKVYDGFGHEEVVLERQDHCFLRNFPMLTVKNARLTDCFFVNCGQLTLEEGSARDCIFENVEVLFLDNVEVSDCQFREMKASSGDFIISLEDSRILNSEFSDIHLKNGVYLADGVGDCLIKDCSFSRVHTDRLDNELFICQKTIGRLLRKKVCYDMLHRQSCKGLPMSGKKE